MRRIYLVRHGLPLFPEGERYCLGSADFPLDTLGRLQACRLGHALKDEKLRVFTSPLKRAFDTACFIDEKPTVIDALQEMHAGEWDGLSFRYIKEKWPGIFLARAENKDLPIPGAEDWYEGQARFFKAVQHALSQSEGDIAIVAHTTVILSFICHVMGDEQYRLFKYRQDYGSYYLAELSDEGTLSCRLPWISPDKGLDRELCRKLLEAACLPGHIIAHCEAVAQEAARITAALNKAGLGLDGEKIYQAALLHDIARLEEDHPGTGAKWLSELGYEDIAQIVRQHHDPESDDIDEAAVLYIADKLIAEDKKVPLMARFEKSRAKCQSAEAIAAHERRQKSAGAIAEKINRICNMEVIV